MTLLRLVRRNLGAHPARAALLFAFAALTVFLFVFLRSILTTLDEAVRAAPSDLVFVQSGVGMLAELPTSYRAAIEQIEGVESVCRSSWFGGIYRDPSNAFPSLATDLDAFLGMYRELEVPDDQRRALLEDRRGCVIGRRLADRFGLRLGDTIPLLGTLYPLPDGRAWEFVVRAIYRSNDPAFPETLHLFHWSYLDDTRRTIPSAEESAGLVNVFMVKVVHGRDIAAVSAAIDARYARGPQRTLTQTEQAHREGEIAMLGEIPAYLGLVSGTALVAMLLAVINAMGISARERRPQAGLLQALGFADHVSGRLLLVESLLVVGLGGVLGVVLGMACVPAWRALLGDTLSTYAVRQDTVLYGCAVSAGIAFLGGLPPAIRIARTRALDVLRQEG